MFFFIYISIGFIALQLINVIINFVFRQRIIQTNFKSDDFVSVLIPARNEEKNIGVILSSIKYMHNENIEIIVFDDHSTDNTAEIVKHFAKNDARIQLMQSHYLPPDWLGKNYACYQLSQKAKGAYFLFLDADVDIKGNVITDVVSYLKKHKLGLLSVFPKQIQKSIGEKMTVPLMNYILLTLLPLIFVRISPFKSHAAANGQFMLFDAVVYKKTQPHKQFKKSMVEDITIARYFKKLKIKIACLIGEKRICCRMYNSYNHALMGFSKNIFMFFGNFPIFAFIFWILATFTFIPFFFYPTPLIWLFLFIIILVQVLYAYTCKQNIFYTLIFFPIHLFFMSHVMINAIIRKKKKNYLWKDRNIS